MLEAGILTKDLLQSEKSEKEHFRAIGQDGQAQV
jgi:hypothetical protein